MKIEAIFGGILALFVLGVVLFAAAPGLIGGGAGGPRPGPGPAPAGPGGGGYDITLCGCFDEASSLALTDAGVLSADYRTGFERCRAQLGAKGGEYWTAGWNAVRSSKPWAASCRAYERSAV